MMVVTVGLAGWLQFDVVWTKLQDLYSAVWIALMDMPAAEVIE